MNCSDAERLFDAFLDRQLSGTLRLELDAHRLRCRRCQQTLAMLESCGDVIASDRLSPELSEDFSDRVMAEIGEQQEARSRVYRFRTTRVAIVVGGLIQAAAVVIFAIWLPLNSDSSTQPAAIDQHDGTALTAMSEPDVRSGVELFWQKIDQGIRATSYLSESTRRTAMYLNMDVAEAVASASAQRRSPGLLGLLDSLLSGPPRDQAEPDDEGSTQFSL